jgi:hypothetical protein
MKLDNEIIVISAGAIGLAQIRHLIPDDNLSIIMIDDVEDIQERLKNYTPIIPPPKIEPLVIKEYHDYNLKTKKPVNHEWKQRLKNLQNQRK